MNSSNTQIKLNNPSDSLPPDNSAANRPRWLKNVPKHETVIPYWLDKEMTLIYNAGYINFVHDQYRLMTYFYRQVRNREKIPISTPINIKSKDLKNFKKKYRPDVESAVELGWLNIPLNKETGVETYSKEHGRAKLYQCLRLKDAKWVTSSLFNDTKRPLNIKVPPNKVWRRNIAEDAVCKIVADTIDNRYFVEKQMPRNIPAKDYVKLVRLAAKQSNVTRPDPIGRLYHGILLLSSKYRSLVPHIERWEMVENDMVACWAWLILKYTSGAERAAYQLLLKGGSGDFYLNLSDLIYNLIGIRLSRDGVKQRWTAYVGGGFKANNIVSRVFGSQFPDLNIKIIGNLHVQLWFDEAAIFIDRVIPRCAVLKLDTLPMHDGTRNPLKYNDLIIKIIKEAYLEVQGYEALIKTTIEKTLDLTPEPVLLNNKPSRNKRRRAARAAGYNVGGTNPPALNLALSTPTLEELSRILGRTVIKYNKPIKSLFNDFPNAIVCTDDNLLLDESNVSDFEGENGLRGASEAIQSPAQSRVRVIPARESVFDLSPASERSISKPKEPQTPEEWRDYYIAKAHKKKYKDNFEALTFEPAPDYYENIKRNTIG